MRTRAGGPLFWAGMLLLLLLGGCAQSPIGQFSEGASGGPSGGFAAEARAAVAHRFTLSIPAADIEQVQNRHIEACTKLGGSIVSMSISRANQSRVRAETILRVKPESYEAFVASLTAPPAVVTYHSQSGEDLTAPVLDVEKRLSAKNLLRDRLTALLNDPGSKTAADLIALEKGLADAQGEIETLTAQLETLHKRTDWVNVGISYVGTTGGWGQLDLLPLREAIDSVGQTFVTSLSWLISFVAAVVPWIPIVAIGWWGIGRLLRRYRRTKAA